MKSSRPVFRYHGGKWRLAPWIISNFPPHKIYVESFGGGASVLIRKPRSYAEVYNDLDDEIVNTFRVLRDPSQARELERQLHLTPFARAEFELSYTADGDPIEQARRTIVRSFMGFGSGATCGHPTGFRSNSNRSATTPAHDWMNYPNLIASFTKRLQGVVIENKDALELICQHDNKDTLHYIDPPYVHETRMIKGHYDQIYRYEMTDDKHREMAYLLRSLKGKVVVSGYPSDLYDKELFLDWRRVEITSHADGALDRIECLWFSPNIESMRLL